MKDIMGIKLEEGQHVFYFRASHGGGGFFQEYEEAKVIKINSKTVKIEYLGSRINGKKKGQQGNIGNTTGRLFIFSKRIKRERMSFVEQIKVLTERNTFLEAEVDKIHSRFDILDL